MASEVVGGVLLDTHAAIWLIDGTLRFDLIELIAAASDRDGAFVSPISAWEIGLLSARSPDKSGVVFRDGPLAWFDRLVAGPIRLAPFTPAMAVGSSLLPEWAHRDPADRLLVATARVLDIPIMTRDRAILAYAATGAVKAILC